MTTTNSTNPKPADLLGDLNDPLGALDALLNVPQPTTPIHPDELRQLVRDVAVNTLVPHFPWAGVEGILQELADATGCVGDFAGTPGNQAVAELRRLNPERSAAHDLLAAGQMVVHLLARVTDMHADLANYRSDRCHVWGPHLKLKDTPLAQLAAIADLEGINIMAACSCASAFAVVAVEGIAHLLLRGVHLGRAEAAVSGLRKHTDAMFRRFASAIGRLVYVAGSVQDMSDHRDMVLMGTGHEEVAVHFLGVLVGQVAELGLLLDKEGRMARLDKDETAQAAALVVAAREVLAVLSTAQAERLKDATVLVQAFVADAMQTQSGSETTRVLERDALALMSLRAFSAQVDAAMVGGGV